MLQCSDLHQRLAKIAAVLARQLVKVAHRFIALQRFTMLLRRCLMLSDNAVNFLLHCKRGITPYFLCLGQELGRRFWIATILVVFRLVIASLRLRMALSHFLPFFLWLWLLPPSLPPPG